MDANEAVELAEIEQRLLAEFGGVVGAAEVKDRLDAAVERFADASLRTHVMLLIERRATADLRAGLMSTGCDGAAGATAEGVR